MTLRETFKNLFTTKSLSNSTGGIVTRNYAKTSTFNPRQQLRGITYKAIDKIGLSTSVYTPIATRADGKAYSNHPILALQRQPNPRQKGSFMTHMWAMLDEIYGETFWYLARGENTNRIKEVYLLNPEKIELSIDNTTGEVNGYILHKSSGEQIPLTLDEVYHDKRPNPFNEYRGMSVLERASTYVDIEINTANFTMNYVRNSASPSGIVSLPEMDKEAFKQFAMKWREGYEGPENAGKTAFIRGEEAKFQAVGSTLKDIDQKITREMAKDDVLMMFDVPKGLLGMSGDKGLGRSETDSLEYIFAKHKIDPMMRRLDAIYSDISKDLGRESAVTVTHESVIPNDKQFQLEAQSKGVNVWLTVNEVRAQNGLDPLPDGDVLDRNNVIVPEKKTIKLKKKTKLTKSQIAQKKQDENEEYRKGLMKTNETFARKLKTIIADFARTQGSEIVDKINATDKAFDDWLYNIKDESKKLALVITPVVIELMKTQSEDVAHFITGELLEITPEIEREVEARILEISGNYNEQTLRELEKTITEGMSDGESLVKVKKRVEDVYSEAKGYRAERIARTESLRATNRTAELVYQQNGYEKVAWFANPGACEFCASMDGQTKIIGKENFSNIGSVIEGADGGQMRIEYDDIGTPPLHPNCACSLVPTE